MRTFIAAMSGSFLIVQLSRVAAQGPPPTVQKEAMGKLAYWVGTWKGTGTIVLGPGQERQSSVTETIVSKVDGLVLSIDGVGKTKDDAGVELTSHNALGIIWFDLATKQYRFKSFVMQGYSTETELKPMGEGFEWGFKQGANGPTTRYTITNRNGKWREVGEMTTDGTTWRKFFEMNLVKQPDH